MVRGLEVLDLKKGNEIMPKKLSQSKRLLAHFESGGTISAFEAVLTFGITQLSARIIELEQQGFVIGRKDETRNGKTYKRYWLADRPKGDNR